MKILAIDPGNEKSAYVIWNTETQIIEGKLILANEDLINNLIVLDVYPDIDIAVIEMVASYGMAVGKTVFDTVLWIGRFYQYFSNYDIPVKLLYRKEVKMNLCNSMKAKDGNIRQSLIDRFGFVGTKKNQGKLYGVSKDLWSALAIAVTYEDVYLK